MASRNEHDRERNRQRKAEWYQENQKAQHARVKRNQQRIKEWLKAYKSTLSCVKCGENHPATLDFHHRNPKEKEASLCAIWMKGWRKERILREIRKCDVLCSNCHRKHHADFQLTGKAPV